MRPNREKHGQRICDPDDGDCFRACMSVLLGLRNDDNLPHGIKAGTWWTDWHEFLDRAGLALLHDDQVYWPQGLWIASVKSKNFGEATHAIVMKGPRVFFDPSPRKRYRLGEMLAGKGVVQRSYILAIKDPSRTGIDFHALAKEAAA